MKRAQAKAERQQKAAGTDRRSAPAATTKRAERAFATAAAFEGGLQRVDGRTTRELGDLRHEPLHHTIHLGLEVTH